MPLTPIFAFRPAAIYLNDSMIVDWMNLVKMCSHFSRLFSKSFSIFYFFKKSLQARSIGKECLRLNSCAFHPTRSLLWSVTFLLFGSTGKVLKVYAFGDWCHESQTTRIKWKWIWIFSHLGIRSTHILSWYFLRLSSLYSYWNYFSMISHFIVIYMKHSVEVGA